MGLFSAQFQSAPNDSSSTDSEPKATDSEPKATNSDHKATDSEPKATDSEPMATDSEPKVTDSEPKATDSEPRDASKISVITNTVKKTQRGRPPKFVAQRQREEDVTEVARLLKKHARCEHTYAAQQYEEYVMLNGLKCGDEVPAYIQSAIRQGIAWSTAHTYFDALCQMYPPTMANAKQREAYGAALEAEKALADSKPVMTTPAVTLLKIVEALAPRWKLFGALLYITGSRPYDILFLHSTCVAVEKDGLMIEWRLTKEMKGRGKRYEVRYPFKYSTILSEALTVELREKDSTFESLGHVKSIAANVNGALRRACLALGEEVVTTSAFRDHMECALREDNVDKELISKMMHHDYDMGTAHYVPLVRQKNMAKTKI